MNVQSFFDEKISSFLFLKKAKPDTKVYSVEEPMKDGSPGRHLHLQRVSLTTSA